MARELTEIDETLEEGFKEVIADPSTSQAAEWLNMSKIFGKSIFAFEKLMDIFKTDVEAKVLQKQPGTLAWYYDRFLDFQGGDDSGGTFIGDTLTVNEFGILGYLVQDETRQIITKCALAEGSGILSAKIAKNSTTEGEFEKLEADQLAAVNQYASNIKFPGTRLTITSADPDLIRYSLVIYYNTDLSEVTVENNVLAKMDEYRQGMEFNDKFFTQKFIEKILEAAGVVSVEINGMTKQDSGDGATWPAFTVFHQLVSGYFNFDHDNSTLTMTDHTTLY